MLANVPDSNISADLTASVRDYRRARLVRLALLDHDVIAAIDFDESACRRMRDFLNAALGE